MYMSYDDHHKKNQDRANTRYKNTVITLRGEKSFLSSSNKAIQKNGFSSLSLLLFWLYKYSQGRGIDDSIFYLQHNNHHCNATIVVVVIITVIRSESDFTNSSGDDSFSNNINSQLVDLSTLSPSLFLSHTHTHTHCSHQSRLQYTTDD